jgi:hypothetical protein
MQRGNREEGQGYKYTWSRSLFMRGFWLIESGEVTLSPGEIFGGEVEDDDMAPWDPLGSEGEERGARTCS